MDFKPHNYQKTAMERWNKGEIPVDMNAVKEALINGIIHNDWTIPKEKVDPQKYDIRQTCKLMEFYSAAYQPSMCDTTGDTRRNFNSIYPIVFPLKGCR